MADYLSMATDAGEQALDAVKRVQGQAISTLSDVSATVGEYIPELELPFADSVPQPKEIASAYFGLAEKWLKAQKEYTLGLIDAVSPVTEKFLPKKKVAKASPKRAA